MGHLEFVNPPTLAEPFGPFSRAVKAGRLVLISGTSAFSHVSGELAHRLVPPDFESQARLTFENLDRAVRAAGASRNDIAKVTVFLRNPGDYATLNRVRAEFFGDHRPASTAIVTGLIRDDMLLEVEAMAVLPRQRRARARPGRRKTRAPGPSRRRPGRASSPASQTA